MPSLSGAASLGQRVHLPELQQPRRGFPRLRTRLMCRDCQHQSTVTAGTIFETTRTPLRVWLAAAWYLTNQKQGVSALGLQRAPGLGGYQTVWTMLHRFRRVMVRPGSSQGRGRGR